MQTAPVPAMPPADPYSKERLAPVVAEARNWTDLMRRLGLRSSGGQRRVLQEKVAGHGLDTSHFVKRSPWRKYPDSAIAEAAASSPSLREVALKLGATPATGTLSHIRRRIHAAGIDISHFPGINLPDLDLPFTAEQLTAAAAVATSVRGVARILGVPDDSRSRATLSRMLRAQCIDTGHFSHRRMSIPEDRLRDLVQHSTSYADVMRGLGLEANDTNHRRIRRVAARLGLDTSHFKRRTWGRPERPAPAPSADRVLIVLPSDAGRTNRSQLHRALTEIGVPYACEACGNLGEWLGQPITLQIDHVNGDWRDNRRENLRYLCPNCHTLTETWCRQKVRTPIAA
ncbi:HNH endonuclease signature motif containing protein [Streptomyces sp. DG2A-72]|uniref:HNH endonuclease signature motif containing protein n=1 Tax=Streptomyces sp. DG2A-72 TaxID=3051386 RepID=UPI00265C7263|nr:HNH endonuclease signature motif containing protein [Streptomyces sp. DG2A-72]MDO0933507.1 HNH endonuclease signature motif containing protein [Streptomyces sp. DG2A-72]